MKKQKNLLLIFTRNPVLGSVKTRLAARIGDEAALQVYAKLLQHTAEITAPLSVDKQVYYSQEIIHQDLWNNHLFEKRLQQGTDLGERMENAFSQGFEAGYERIIVIGSDLLELSTMDLQLAFDQLREKEFVIGPAKDGGYYLLGMKSLTSRIFRNKRWSTPSVLEDTLKDIGNSTLSLLEERNDIDVYEDLNTHPFLQFTTITYDKRTKSNN